MEQIPLEAMLWVHERDDDWENQHGFANSKLCQTVRVAV